MARHTFGSKPGRGQVRTTSNPAATTPNTDDVIREMKKALEKPKGEDYRDRSLAIHGLVCGRCGREFEQKNRYQLTVHHKDGNHHNNPADGTNWENLCVDCHDDIHSRGVLGEYVNGAKFKDERRVVHEDARNGGSTALGDLMRQALERKLGKKGDGS